MNGRMMKRCGHSFKIFSKSLEHIKYLAGKRIYYGTNIAYIFVRIPNSNKIFFYNYTPTPQDGTQDFSKHTMGSRRNFIGMGLNLIFRSLQQNVCFSNKIRLR